jgi:hypothetical protein
MTNNTLQVPAEITSFKTKGVDVILTVDIIQELMPEDMTTLMMLRNKPGYFVFKPEKFIEEDIITLPEKYDLEAGEKTPSQRLRSVLFVFWNQKRKDKGVDFDSFYKDQMEKFINSVKDKLEPTN